MFTRDEKGELVVWLPSMKKMRIIGVVLFAIASYGLMVFLGVRNNNATETPSQVPQHEPTLTTTR